MANYTTPVIAEQFERTLERAVLDFTHAAGGKQPLAVIVHVEWPDGAMCSAKTIPNAHRSQLMVLLDTCAKHVVEYVRQAKQRINTIAAATGDKGTQ